MWGSRRFRTRDDSRNSFWVALLTFGEGWHNNHHAYPQSARHGMAWYEIDLNWYGIWILRVLRLAWDVKTEKINRSEFKSIGKQAFRDTVSRETGSRAAS
jgi:fatty-acid desaturase